MNQALKNKIEELNKSFFEKNEVEEFLKEHPFEEILSIYTSLESKKDKDFKILREFLSHLSLEPTFSLLFIFNEDPKHVENMEKLLKSEYVETRVLVANALSLHEEEIHIKIKEAHENKKETFLENLKVLFYLFSDPESQVGLKIMKIFLNIANIALKNKETPLFFSQEGIIFLENGLKIQKDVVKMRYMDLIASLAIKFEEKIKELSSLLEKSFEIYKTSDILMKLNAVEILSKLGDSKVTSNFLSNHDFFELLIKEAFDPFSEFYVQKYLILLISKMFGNETMKFDLNIRKKICGFLLNSLNSKSQEENEGGLEVIGNLLQKQQGIDLLIKDKNLFQDYLKFYRSTNSGLKKKFLNSLSKLFKYDAEKNPKALKNIFILLSDVTGKMIAQINFSSENADEESLKGAMNSIFVNLYSPFADFEIEAILFLRELIQYEFGLKELARNAKSIEYILKHFAKTKEIFDVKTDIKDFLKSIFSSKNFQDPIIKDFSKKYLEALEQETKASSMVFYKTEANE